MSASADLRRLQDVDSTIHTLRAGISTTEQQIRRDPELERVREAATAATSERHASEAAASAAEAEMNALQSRVTQLDRRLYGGSVHNPQELMEMQRELETLRGRAREAEERAIELLDDSERAAAAEVSALEALRGAEQRRETAMQPLRSHLEALHDELEKANLERDTLVASLEPSAVALYTRVASRRHPAVAGLEGDSCGGCHLPLSNEERRLVRAATRIVQCSNCDRILVP